MFTAPPACISVSQADLDHIADRDPTASSPYHGVYPDKGGWQAKAYKRRIGGCQTTPREAAKLLIGWWKRQYGERWRAVWSLRQTRGWVPMRAYGGWWARVELAGEAEVLIGQREGQPAQAVTPGTRPFPSKEEASAGVVAWAQSLWGRWGAARVRRTWAAGRSSAKVTPVPLRERN